MTNDPKDKVIRKASNNVYIDNANCGRLVVEVVGEVVLKYYPLTEETANTEWVEQPIHLRTNNIGKLLIKDK